ncbi:hypothetical protein MMC18_004519 [Xylographa bjoerkii]|nr:hypothetical protein [Xylographa bjoerkii]
MSEEAGQSTHNLICQLYGPGKVIFVKCDVTLSSHVEDAVKAAASAGGRLDIMVNNAGLGPGDKDTPIHLFSEQRWDHCINVNLKGIFLGCKYAIAQFLRREPLDAGHRGWIVNMASIKGYVCIMAVEYAKERIHCNALCPGFTATVLMKTHMAHDQMSALMRAATPWGTWGDARDMAKRAGVLASDDAA